MDEWGLNPGSVAAAGTVVAAFALLLAIFGAYASNRQSRRERTLQAFVVLSLDIRKRWEKEWRKFLREDVPIMSLKQRESSEVDSKLDDILNWLDWMGLVIRMELIDPKLLLGTLRPMIVDILRESAFKIQKDIDDPNKGPEWWANVLHVASLPEISVNIEEEAKRVELAGP